MNIGKITDFLNSIFPLLLLTVFCFMMTLIFLDYKQSKSDGKIKTFKCTLDVGYHECIYAKELFNEN